jgi:cellulose synthase/poly-beta-1,6-N-acetylglucosamine synthase-like glycosyltransferase
LNTLAAAASGDLLLLNDVRQPLSANAVRDLTRPFTDPAVGCATGRLVLTGGAGSGVYWRYEEWIRRNESRFRGVVGMTGPLGMVRRADFIPVPTDIILDDVWLPMSLVLAGKRVVLVPTAEAHDTAFADQREFSRKVRTLAGNYQLFAKLPQLLLPFINPIWFETFSHKLMRLCAPWMLLLLLGSSLVAATGDSPGLVRALVIAQLLFYGMAAIGPKGGRLSGVARTFVVLNVAAIVGLGRFLTGRQRITWKTGRESGSAAASERAAPHVQVSSGPTKS